MRALIIISASLATVMEPSTTWATNSLIRFLPRSRAWTSVPNRPCSTIWSSSPFSSVVVSTAAFCTAAAGSGIWLLLRPHLFLQFLEALSLSHGFEQYVLELVVPLQG